MARSPLPAARRVRDHAADLARGRRAPGYRLPDYGVELAFEPWHFTQVNASINRRMVAHALALLDPRPGDKVLDLFCGLGNFTLPLARRAFEVVGVEGGPGLVEWARGNAGRNGITNVRFHRGAAYAAPRPRRERRSGARPARHRGSMGRASAGRMLGAVQPYPIAR